MARPQSLDERGPGSGATPSQEGGASNSGVVGAGAVREFPCDGCGARLEFHIGQQQLCCPYCGFQKALALAPDAAVHERDYEAAVARLSQRGVRGSTQLGELEIGCRGCGATVAFSGQLSTAECPFCGLAVQREDAHRSADRLEVDAVLPFKVEESQAKAQLKRWVESRWFAPNEFKRRGVQGRFNGLYLPFWTYDSATYCRYMGERGTVYMVSVGSGKQRRTEMRVRWTPASGAFDRFFDDVTVAATTRFPAQLLHALEPWPLQQARPFNGELLAGKHAMTYDVELTEGFSQAQARIRSELEAEARQRIGGDRQRIHSLDVRHNAITYKHLLLPVWMLAYRYQDKSYQVVVNACTGEVQGERPWSVLKILCAVVVGTALLLVALRAAGYL